MPFGDWEDGLDCLRIFSAVATDAGDFTITGNGTSQVTVSLDTAPANTITVNGNGGANVSIDAGDFLFY